MKNISLLAWALLWPALMMAQGRPTASRYPLAEGLVCPVLTWLEQHQLLSTATFLSAVEKKYQGRHRWAVLGLLAKSDFCGSRERMSLLYRNKILAFDRLTPREQFTVTTDLYLWCWDADLVYPALECLERCNSSRRYNFLDVLDVHAMDWVGQPGFSSRLFKVAWARRQHYADAELVGSAGWLRGVQLLSQTRDSAAVVYLASFLTDTSQLDQSLLRDCAKGIVTPRHKIDPPCPNRVCDVALESIYYAQGRDLRQVYQDKVPLEQYVDSRDPQKRFLAFSTWDNVTWKRIRDELIIQLQTELTR